MKHRTVWTLAALALLIGPAVSQLGPNGILPIGPGGGGSTSAKGIITACGASNNQLLWDSSGSCAGLATANSATLITSGAGVPSISQTLPSAVQGNITSLGTVTSGTFNGALTPGTTTLTGGAANQLLYDNGGTLTETATLPFGITMSSTVSNGAAYVNTSNHLPTSVGTTKQTVIAGNQDLDGAPTLTADGQAWIFNGAGNGMQIQGRGSSSDVQLLNRTGTLVLAIPTNTTTVQVYGQGLILLTSNADTGIARNGAGVLEINSGTVGTLRDLTARNTTFSGTITNTGIAADTGHTDATVCEDTTSHTFFSGTGAAGICLGTSSVRYKHDVEPLGVGLDQIMGLQPVRYRLNEGYGDPTKLLYGFTAENGAVTLPQLVEADAQGRPNRMDYMGVVPVLVRAIQQQQAQIEELRLRVK